MNSPHGYYPSTSHPQAYSPPMQTQQQMYPQAQQQMYPQTQRQTYPPQMQPQAYSQPAHSQPMQPYSQSTYPRTHSMQPQTQWQHHSMQPQSQQSFANSGFVDPYGHQSGQQSGHHAPGPYSQHLPQSNYHNLLQNEHNLPHSYSHNHAAPQREHLYYPTPSTQGYMPYTTANTYPTEVMPPEIKIEKPPDPAVMHQPLLENPDYIQGHFDPHPQTQGYAPANGNYNPYNNGQQHPQQQHPPYHESKQEHFAKHLFDADPRQHHDPHNTSQHGPHNTSQHHNPHDPNSTKYGHSTKSKPGTHTDQGKKKYCCV